MIKKVKYIVIISLFFWGCEKLIPDLQRDNPNDINNPNYTESNGTPELIFSRYEITKEIGGIQNGIINSGEYIYLLVYVKNIGDYKAEKVRGTITTSNNYVTHNNSELNFVEGNPESDSYHDYISADTVGYARIQGYYSDTRYSISFQVSITPSNTDVIYNIEMEDDNGVKWTDNFTITVYE